MVLDTGSVLFLEWDKILITANGIAGLVNSKHLPRVLI